MATSYNAVAQSGTQQVIQRAKSVLLQNYKQQPVALERGQGSWVWDVEGKRYLDLIGGIATCGLGHCHPQVTTAALKQMGLLWHVSNGFYTLPQIELAERLIRASGMDRAFFCNSGAEANEALIKLARKVQKDRGHPERFTVISFVNSFHGRTLATLSATGQAKYQQGFEPLPQGFINIPFGDLGAVESAIDSTTAAILVEPIQGEGGVRSGPLKFLQGLRALTLKHGLLLLVDEIQTGIGRTGKMFAFQHEAISPDAISMAKALGNGLPIGAMACTEEVGASLGPGTHGSTFGGNPVACAAANAVVSIVDSPAFLTSVQEKGEFFRQGLRVLQAEHPSKIVTVRGQGLLVGLEMTGDVSGPIGLARDEGLLVNAAGEKTVRFAPPLNISYDELEEGLALLGRALRRVA